MSASLNYKILMEDIAENKKRDSETTITLNETKLKADRDALEAKALVRLNRLRAAKGLPAAKKGDKLTNEDIFDFVQDESLRVMVDFMKLSGVNSSLTKVSPAFEK
jgi:carboxyl-terminal processing protease